MPATRATTRGETRKSQIKDFVDALKTTGFSVLKMSARYMPEKLPLMVDEYNSRWDAYLTVEDGHFLTIAPHKEKSRCYWDFEISKRWISGNLTLEELDYCHEHLVEASVRELEGDQKNYLLSLDLNYRYMAQKFTKILEFPVG